jgi:hypothetical protein
VIKSRVLNVALLVLGVFLVGLAVGYATDGTDQYHGAVAVLQFLLGLWCILSSITNFRKRHLAVQPPYTFAERVAISTALGILSALAIFVLLVVLDVRFGYNISSSLLVVIGALATWLSLSAVPLLVWLRASKQSNPSHRSQPS